MTWNIDPMHSNVEFSVRHMAISTVRGRFETLEGQAETDENGQLKSVKATIEANSVSTSQADRDAHLRSPDFFDVAQFPKIEFVSTSVEPKGENTYNVTGNLTMHGITRPVTFKVEATPPVKDLYGNQRAAIEAKASLSRKDWGLTWNQALEFGGVLVSDEVKFTLDVQATQAQ